MTKLEIDPQDPAVLWESFCEALKGAGDVLRRPETPRDAQTIAESYRHLVRMIRVGFENTFEVADVEHPQLTAMVGRFVQYEGITSDARYLHTFLDGSATHRIRGTRGDAPLIEFGVYTGKMGLHDPSHLVASITEEALEVGDDGSIEVMLSPKAHEGNWIETDGKVRYAMIRQYAPAWEKLTPGRFEIERIDPVAPDAAPFDLDAMRAGLEATVDFATKNPLIWAGISDYWADFSPNAFVPELDADDLTDIAPPSGHHFNCGYFDLNEDPALLISFRPGEAALWTLGITSYWYETIGYGRPDSHLNSGSAVADPDGTVRIALSRERPPPEAGIPNWLDPRGHVVGTMVFRWSRAKSPMPEIACEPLAWPVPATKGDT